VTVGPDCYGRCYGSVAALGLGAGVAPTEGVGVAEGSPAGLDGPPVGVAPAEVLALGVLVGVVVADGVGDGAGLVLVPGVGEGAGVCPDPELAGKAVRRWLVDAWIAVRAAIATTKMTTQSPATASHRRRRTGRPARRLLHDNRLDAGA
jgi:hypothetical protein